MLPTPRFSPWLRVLIFGVGAAIASVIFTGLVLLATSFAVQKAGRDVGAVQGELGEYALWLNLLAYPTIWMWLVFCRRSYDRRPVRALGLRTQSMMRALSSGAVAGVMAVAWLCGMLWLCGGVQFNGFSTALSTLSPIAIVGQMSFYALIFAAVGFMEEAIFRGYALHNFGAAIGLRAAIWLQAILFALIHLGNIGAGGSDVSINTQWIDALRALPSLALIGATFALFWAKSGTLWYSIGFHGAWNFALGCIFSLPVSGLKTFRLFDIAASGNSWINGGSFGAEGSILLWPILAALWLVLRRLPDHPQALHDLNLLEQSAPQVLAASQNLMPVPENEPEDTGVNQRRSRFQTSMRAAREADENNLREFPILGQLPDKNEINDQSKSAASAPSVTDFSHAWTPLPESAPNKQSIETAPAEDAPEEVDFSDADFQFQPLPAAPKSASPTKLELESAAPEGKNSGADDTMVTNQTSEIEVAATETSATETSAPVRQRPTARW